ncbi:MAG: DUF2157 domain-containing protein [Methylotenera sp.]|nr:DUF2157 domain-containing protein [Methylotenera sp.]MDP1755567.1 DUF2157 domain-containing protein [Methylotenera sp.]MDP1959076.1 DUF2157 domain-containing protein [Methylotenera sp.]MDP3304226.1 DUF2157 domain-containing protein [Methylotenera sp.]MDP3942915.1 DUF2157 domain-containing protein [Methylotenera sp.]
MSLKEDALQDIVSLARHNKITLEEIAQAFNSPKIQTVKASSSVLSKLFGYIGGIFVFAGIGVFISMYWDDFGSAARVIVTLGTGLVAFIMGLVCLADKKYERAATPLFLISSFLQPTGILVMLQEYSSGGDVRHGMLFMAVYMLIQQGATFWAKGRTVLALSAILFGSIFFANLFDILGVNEKLIGIIIGTSLLCIAYALNQSKHLAIASFWYFIGAVTLLWSIFELVEKSPLEPVYLGASALIIFLSTNVRSRTLLLVGTLSMLFYIGYYTAQHFANTVGWPIALVMIGIALIAVSSLAVRLNNKYIKSVS